MKAWLRCTLVLLLVAMASALSARQDGKTPRKEEEDDPPVKKIDKKEEEETPPKTDKSRVLDIDDDPKEKTPPPRPSGDLATLAASEKDPEFKAFFKRLSVPTDLVEHTTDPIKGRVAVVRSEPIKEFVPSGKSNQAALTLRPLAKPGAEVTIKARAIRSVRYYEKTAADDIEKFMAVDNGPRLTRLAAAEQALSAVLRFHQSAAIQGTRAGSDWRPLEERLRKLLLEAIMGQMDALVESKSWKAAFDLTARLADAAPRTAQEDNKRVVGKVTAFLNQALRDATFAKPDEIRLRMRRLEELFPGSGVGKPIADELRSKAGDLLKKAGELGKGEEAQAVDLLRQAADLWPDLPGLREAQVRLDRSYQMLRVGVRLVPEKLTPATAATEAELRAMDLMYEGLVHLVPDSEGRLYYEPQLAKGRPEVLALGRRFLLPAGAKWGDAKGSRIIPPHVRIAVKRLKDSTTGRAKAFADLLDEPELEGDSSRVSLRLTQGFLDPLAPMAFKILPESADTPSFEAKPYGSGPFKFGGVQSDTAGGNYASFLSNPHYGAREGRKGQPRISEVRFYSPTDPVKALSTNVIDLAMDLTGEEAAEADKQGYIVRKADKANRRIWFLAVNNRVLKDAELRLALARAVPREAILEKVFRKGWSEKRHSSLNGPYPAGSWASDPTLVAEGKPADPYDPELAKAKAKEALQKAGLKLFEFTLLHPTGDKQAEKAINELCEAVSKATDRKVQLTKSGLAPHEFKKRVEAGDYQLAYCHYDFPEGAFWLGPLLAAGERGENLLNYSGPLQGKIETAMKSRFFGEVKKRAHEIHRQFLTTEMPFIPLWQLDPLMAMKRGVIDAPPFEATHPFARIGEWRVVR